MRLLLALSGCLLLGGCLPFYVPTPQREFGTRHHVEKGTLARLKIGRSTIADVLLLLGEPDSGGDLGPLNYRWYSVHGAFVLIGIVSVATEVGSKARLSLEFDETGILRAMLCVDEPMKTEIAVMPLR